MAQAYVDDHRLILHRAGQPARDITAFASDMQAVDELRGLSVELSFQYFVSEWDKYTPRLALAPGDRVSVVNHGKTVFDGIIQRVGLDGGVTAYDRGWYLSKSQIILQCTGMRADEAIRAACAKAGVPATAVCALPTLITEVWLGETPADILAEILERCSAETGKEYHYYMRDGGLVVEPLGETFIRAYHRPAANVASFDITWALGKVTGEDSIADLYNAVVIAAEDSGRVYIGAQAKNAESVKKYGFMQRVERVNDNPGTARLGQMARTLLQQSDRVGRTRNVGEIWGCDEVHSGVVLSFNSPAFGLDGRHRVTRVTHHYGGAGHTMELEVLALEQPRAAGGTDTVQVWGLPDHLSGSASSGGNAVTGSADAFLRVARGELGYRERRGNRNKYGAWAGNDGVAWCVYFIGWCAAKASAPIPTKYGYVGDMSDYFMRRHKYHTVASGYIPQPGDLMIQGTRHIGIVESATRTAVQTIEGNCSDSVRRMTRKYSEITGFCTPWG